MSIGYLGAMGAYQATMARRETKVYAGPSRDSDVLIVWPAGTSIAVQRLADRPDWFSVPSRPGMDDVGGYVNSDDINIPSSPRAASLGPATKVFAVAVAGAALWLLVTK